MRWPLAVVLACACSKSDTVPSSIKRVEKAMKHELNGLVLVHEGLYLDRKFVTDTALPEALAKMKPRELLDIWLLDDPEPATTIIGALQVVADKHPRVSIHHLIPDGTADRVCQNVTVMATQAASDPESVALSVMMLPDRIWVGLSRVNEFQDIPPTTSGVPDYEKLETTLKQHRESAFFADRRDLELSAEPTVSSERFAELITVACLAGWTKLAMLRVDQISARPSL